MNVATFTFNYFFYIRTSHIALPNTNPNYNSAHHPFCCRCFLISSTLKW